MKGEPHVLPSKPGEKALLVAVLLLVTFGGYYAVGLLLDPARATSAATPLDQWIPFRPVFTWIYTLVYTWILVAVFTIRCQGLFRRVCASYLFVVVVCLIVYLIHPVTAIGLRGDLSAVDPQWFHQWGLRVNYDLDPPLNCLPSLHVSIAFVTIGFEWKAKRAYGILAAVVATLIAVSVCFVKQHFVLDVVLGVALAAVAYAVVVRPYDRGDAPDSAVAYDWRGPASYAAFHTTALLTLYVCFRVGLKTWT